jgi:hypothetical protein
MQKGKIDDLPAELTMREWVKEVTTRAKKFKSPDVSKMPGVRYKHNGAVDTYRFFKSESRRKKFMKENEIDELIN